MSKRKTIEEYKEQVKKVWGDRYTIPPYSVYNGTHSIITVTCPIHGDFEVEAKSFLYGHGCKKCANEKKHNNNSPSWIQGVSMVGKYFFKGVLNIVLQSLI